ncbi:MAG: Gfo/Idh/MocA family oxidoreductase [Candidatus Latescibacteria bacterium]|nr:Gfo/Idh/MocA family oxidoreductase [Candidatus Latescibacterota bacterium]
MATITVGFIGAGGNARGHMEELRQLEGVRIAAICDVVEEIAQSAANVYGGKVYTDYRRMLDKESPTVVYISIPPYARGGPELEVARRGIHLFVEKPVALSLEKGLEICEAVEKAGIITCVGYQLRYCETTDRARAFLSNRTIAMVVVNRWGGMVTTPWWRIMTRSGGQIVEQTTHQVDLIRYLAGDIVEVHAYYALRTLYDIEGCDIPDVSIVSLRFASGAIGSISSSCALTKGGGRGDLAVIVRDRILYWTHRNLELSPPGDFEELRGISGATSSIDETFTSAIRRNDRSGIRSSYRDALKTLDVTLAANRSATAGKPIQPYFAEHK